MVEGNSTIDSVVEAAIDAFLKADTKEDLPSAETILQSAGVSEADFQAATDYDIQKWKPWFFVYHCIANRLILDLCDGRPMDQSSLSQRLGLPEEGLQEAVRVTIGKRPAFFYQRGKRISHSHRIIRYDLGGYSNTAELNASSFGKVVSIAMQGGRMLEDVLGARFGLFSRTTSQLIELKASYYKRAREIVGSYPRNENASVSMKDIMRWVVQHLDPLRTEEPGSAKTVSLNQIQQHLGQYTGELGPLTMRETVILYNMFVNDDRLLSLERRLAHLERRESNANPKVPLLVDAAYASGENCRKALADSLGISQGSVQMDMLAPSDIAPCEIPPINIKAARAPKQPAKIVIELKLPPKEEPSWHSVTKAPRKRKEPIRLSPPSARAPEYNIFSIDDTALAILSNCPTGHTSLAQFLEELKIPAFNLAKYAGYVISADTSINALVYACIVHELVMDESFSRESYACLETRIGIPSAHLWSILSSRSSERAGTLLKESLDIVEINTSAVREGFEQATIEGSGSITFLASYFRIFRQDAEELLERVIPYWKKAERIAYIRNKSSPEPVEFAGIVAAVSRQIAEHPDSLSKKGSINVFELIAALNHFCSSSAGTALTLGEGALLYGDYVQNENITELRRLAATDIGQRIFGGEVSALDTLLEGLNSPENSAMAHQIGFCKGTPLYRAFANPFDAPPSMIHTVDYQSA